MDWIPGSRRSPGEGNSNRLQYSCLGNPMDRGASWATCSPWDHKRVRHDLATKQQHIYVSLHLFNYLFNYSYSLSVNIWWPLARVSYGAMLLFSCSVLSNSLQPHGRQHARLPCPSPTLRAYSNSCPSCWWYHSTISSSVIPISSHLQCFPASESFLSWFFPSGGQRIGVSASASVLSMNIQDWFPLGWTGLITLQSKGLSSLFQHHSSKESILGCSAFFIVHLSHPYMTTGKS